MLEDKNREKRYQGCFVVYVNDDASKILQIQTN